MSQLIILMGESGAGKSTSLRNLPPEQTVYIDADGKGLSWKGWRKQYNADTKNYFKLNQAADIQKTMQIVNTGSKYQNIKYFVVDTLNSVMVADEMKRATEKGYDKWIDLAQSVYGIVTSANALRDDLTIILLAHTQTINDDNGYQFTSIKTNGKKLNKICLESYANWVLLAKRKGTQYVFEVQANNSSAKTPMGAFDKEEIPNDILEVIKVLEDF